MRPGIIWGFFLGVMTVNGFGADNAIFTYRLGRFEVYMLVENRGQGRSSILLGADEAQIRRYMPRGTYQSETNTFLIRTPDRIILVDTGFGGALFEGLKELGIRPDQVDAVLLTHMHGDHIGGLQKDGKALFPKAKVYLARQERDFWVKPGAAAAAALAPYGSQVETFLPGELGTQIRELLPGISPIAAFGHTPGHTLYMVESEGKKLLIWGDLVHAQDIQLPLPDVSVTYDTDPQAAAAIRKQVLDYAAKNAIPIGGMHLVYPAIGTMSPASVGGYHLTPAE